MKDTVGPLTDDIGNVIIEDCVNVKRLNECFASISTKENLVDIPMFNKASYIDALNLLISRKRQCMTNFVSSGSTYLLV